jgi:hypothetical protein
VSTSFDILSMGRTVEDYGVIQISKLKASEIFLEIFYLIGEFY